MQKTLHLKLLPADSESESAVKKEIAHQTGVPLAAVTGFNILKKSIDSRGRQPWIIFSVRAFIDEPWQTIKHLPFHYPDVHASARKVVIVGAGPAGLFAALRLIEAGIKPIILDRGKDVRSRRRDLAILNKDGIIDPDSNYCFGEGGAGTYSDGKLYTRSTKRGDVHRVLSIFYHFGADENILYESHPHIGTNKLPRIITSIRQQITDAGGHFLFEKKVTDLVVDDGCISAVKTSDGSVVNGEAVILATGHSARDVFHLLFNKKIQIESSPFALGVRVEHPQQLINNIQYHGVDHFLPPASYKLVQQVHGSGVFSFCMCPGGIIAPASTDNGELVVNGWSPSKRNNPYANSGVVVQLHPDDLHSPRDFEEVMQVSKKLLHSPLGMMYFQEYVERKAFREGGGKFVAPAQRLVDFCENRISPGLPRCSYLPGVRSASLQKVLPPVVYEKLREAFREFGKKMKGYYTNDAIVVATESRTSSPVRIPRHDETLQHTQIKNLYPCGEGAGFAGGIVSAAMDGEKVATRISQTTG